MKPLTAALIAVQQNADLLKGTDGSPGKQGRPGIEGKAGDPGLTWRGTFAYGTTYQPGDVVEWEGSSYVALVVTARRPPDPEWDLLAAKGEPGASGRGYIRGGGGSGAAGVTDHAALTGLAGDDHPQYTTDAEATTLADASVTTHAGLADPHTGYRLESADHSHVSSGAQGGQIAGADLSGTPGGELGGTWASPTVDATHSGSTHAATQAAAEATASGALTTHAAAADPHTGYVREADASWIDLTDSGATTLHSHAGGSGLTHPQVLARALGA